MALYDPHHPLHAKIEGEWRGLAALIALSQWRNRRIEMHQVSLEGKDSQFAEIARKLTPSKSLSNDTKWGRLQIIYDEGDPIAVTSPTTLFSTAVQYSALGLDWFDGNVLCDPLRVNVGGANTRNVLNGHEKNAVANWLQRIEDDLARHSGLDTSSETWNKLLGVIHRFRDDLGGVQRALQFKRDALNVSTPDIFRYLDEVPLPPEGNIQDSAVRMLDPNRDSRSEPDLLILSNKIAEQWNMGGHEIRVWGVHTLHSAQHAKGAKTQLKGTQLEGAEWRREEDFFNDELYLVRATDAFDDEAVWVPRGAAQLEGAALVPVKRELLHYFSPAELADRISFSSSGRSGVKVRLTVELSGTGREPREMILEKTYSHDEVQFIENIPVVEIWPRINSEQYNRYYTFFSGARSFFVKPYPEPVEGGSREELRREREVVRANYATDFFPEVYTCYESGRGAYAGLLLLRPVAKQPSRAGSWTVGVDFGTANTTVYVNRGGAVEEVSFDDRLLSVTKPVETERRRTVSNGFLPPCEQETPFPTLYQLLYGKQSSLTAPDVLLDGHIFYINDISYKAFREDKRNGEGGGFNTEDIYSDLKWSDDPEDRKLIKAFLEQLCLQVRAEAAAEGIKDIDWAYSVPTSFSRDQRDFIRAIWDDLVEEGTPDKKTESLCTAAYFLDAQQASLASGAICIDIGGASADIAIWQQHEMLLQTSLLLASREIFVKTIQAAPERFERLFGQVPPAWTFALEALLDRQGDDLLGRLKMQSGTEAVKTLRQHVALGASFILFYAGLLVRDLVSKGAFKDEGTLPNIYFGGNGSKMLHWLGNDRFRHDNPFKDLFEEVLAEASGLSTDRLKVVITPPDKMKHEVAHGLVTDNSLEPTVDTVIVAGESFDKGDGTSHEWDYRLKADDFTQSLSIDPDLKRLREAVTIVNRYASRTETSIDPWDPDTLRGAYSDTLDQVKNHMVDLSKQSEENMDAEPLFIIAARTMLRVIREN